MKLNFCRNDGVCVCVPECANVFALYGEKKTPKRNISAGKNCPEKVVIYGGGGKIYFCW